MKNSLFIILILLIMAGCGDQKTKDLVEENADAGEAGDSLVIESIENEKIEEPIQLRYKLEEGESYTYKLTNISNDFQTIQADTTIEQNLKQNVTFLIDLNVEKVESGGTMEISSSFRSVDLNAVVNGENFKYSTGSKIDSVEKAKFSDYVAMENNPFTIRVSPSGDILEVFRVDKIVDKFLELKGYADSLNTEQKNQLRMDIIQSAIKPLLIQLFRKMPEEKVKTDSLWKLEQSPTQFMVFQLQNTNTYKITDLGKVDGDLVAVLDAGLITKVTGKTEFSDRGVDYSFQKPKTKAEGTVTFNVDKGLILESETQTIVDIYYTMEVPTPQGKQKGSKTEKVVNKNILKLVR